MTQPTKEPPHKVLRIVKQVFYHIDMLDEKRTQINGWPIERVIEDWFLLDRINHPHVTRKNRKIYGADGLIHAELLDIEQFEKSVELGGDPETGIARLRQDKAELVEAAEGIEYHLEHIDDAQIRRLLRSPAGQALKAVIAKGGKGA